MSGYRISTIRGNIEYPPFSDKLTANILVDLTDVDSNQFDIVIRFKKSLPTGATEADLCNNLSPAARKVNDYGEIVATKVKQEQKRLSDEEIDLLVAGYREGKSTYQLARELGCHRNTVSNALKERSVKVSKAKIQDRLDIEAVVKMYEQKHTTQEIGEKYNVYPQVILRCLRKQGVKIRNRWDY